MVRNERGVDPVGQVIDTVLAAVITKIIWPTCHGQRLAASVAIAADSGTLPPMIDVFALLREPPGVLLV